MLRTSKVMSRVHMINEILNGLTPDQAEQSRTVLVKAPDLELKAIYLRRRSFALGAPPIMYVPTLI